MKRNRSYPLFANAGSTGTRQGLLPRAATGTALAATVALLLGSATASDAAFAIRCEPLGDEFGYSIATNGDYNGDGVNDIAVGAPCSQIGIWDQAGRAVILSGVDGKRLLSLKGKDFQQWMGASVQFIGDINGDGRDELAVGSPGYRVNRGDRGDVPTSGLAHAGRIDVYQKRKRRFTVFGPNRQSGFGNLISPLGDVDGDNRPDFAVASPRDQIENGSLRRGRVYIISGKRGGMLGFKGGHRGGGYGASLAGLHQDVTGDGVNDFIAGSNQANVIGVPNSGVVDVVSPLELEEEVLQITGARRDGLGSSAAASGDINNDGMADFVIGSVGSDDSLNIRGHGLVSMFRVEPDQSFSRQWVVADSAIQEHANFGSSLAIVGDLNGDGIDDVVAGASGYDSAFGTNGAVDAGRIVALSGANGSELWSKEGQSMGEEFGHSVGGNIDWDLDGTPDVVVGIPGADALGRRGAGAIKIFDGRRRRLLFEKAGRRGIETRVVMAAPFSANSARLRSIKHGSKKGEINASVMGGHGDGALSLAILEDRGKPAPKDVMVAVGSGKGGGSSTVEVYRLGSRRELLDSFDCFASGIPTIPDVPTTGVNVAAGQLDGDAGEDLVCAQADSSDGNVYIRVFRRLHDQLHFYIHSSFQVFSADERLDEFFSIDAAGATVAVGNVMDGPEDEIIVGTTGGVPMVKIFSAEGVLLSSFLAYPPVWFGGVEVAVGEVNGGGTMEIITAPHVGQAFIKIWRADGTIITTGPNEIRGEFNVMPESFHDGARVAAADVDLDGMQEILVTVPGPSKRKVMAFETTSEEVRGFNQVKLFPESSIAGAALAGTDVFVRN